MARVHTKDLANRLYITGGAVGALLNGASAISAHLWAYALSYDTANANNNRLLDLKINGSSSGLLLGVDGTDSNKSRVGGRSQSADSFQARNSTNAVSLNTWTSIGGVLDIAGDVLTPYLSGVAENSGAATFGAATFTHGTPEADSDGIGGHNGTGIATDQQWDGYIGEVAVWAGDIGAAGFASLAKGFSPLLIRPELLVFYMPLIRGTTERDLISGRTGTILGTIGTTAHPRVFYPATYQTAQDGANQPADQPSHRLTETFLEVPYRDPLVAAPARLSEEFAEVPIYAALTPLSDGPRLTQQTVEILYLEPDPDPIFNDCGQFAGLREWEARLYDAHDPSTGKRKAYGPDGYDFQDLINQLNFEIQEKGGYGGGSIEFMGAWEDVDLEGTERVDVWLWDAPAYRGYLRVFQKDIASPEFARPQFYGMVGILDEWKVRRKYAYGCDTDVATIARDIALDYVAITGRFPNVSLDMSTTVGATLKEYDGRGKSVAECFNELCDLAPNLAIWGAEMDSARPIPGDTLYFRPRPTETAYVVAVGDNVEAFTYPRDTHEIVNSLKITGGPVLQPNLAPNGSFEEIKPASEDNGNLLIDHDFEANNSGGQWQLLTGSGSDASIKQSGAGADAFGAGRSGQYWGEIDTANEEIYQEVNIISGRRYEASVWARLEDGTANTGTLYLEGRTSAGALVVTVSVALTGLTTTYKRFSVDLDLASYATVAKLRYRVVSNAGTANNDGILVDDCGVYEYCSVAQEFWEVNANGNATISDLDWDYDGPVEPRTGEYMVKIDAANIALSTDYVEIYNRIVNAPSVDPNERYTLLVWWHTNGAGTPTNDALSIGAVSINSSGVQGTTFQSDTFEIAAGPPSTFAAATQCATLAITTESTTAKLQLFVRVRTNEVMYIDDVMLVKGEVPEEVLSYGGYWPADTYERYIDVEDSLLTGSLDTDVDDSITDYGQHDDEMDNQLVTDRQTAIAFAAGVFNARALPKVEGSLTIYGARKLIRHEGLLRLVNLPSAPAALWPARSSYTVTGDAITCSVELGNQRPELASLLLLTAGRNS